MHSLHSVHAASTSATASKDLARRQDRTLALRERAVLRLAARQGAVAVTVRVADTVVPSAYDQLNLIATLSERGLLRYGGVRQHGGSTDVIYHV